MPDYIKPYVSYLMNFGAFRGNARQETIMNENTSGVKTASDEVVHHCCMTWILHNRKRRRYLWLSTLAAFCVRTTCKQECITPKLHTLNYPGNGSDSSSSVNTYYYCYLCCVYTSSCAWVWVHDVRQSLFNAARRLCKWKHHTLPKCSRLNAAVWRTLFAWLSPGCRETENTPSQVSVLLLSAIQLYLCLKMATLAKHTQWGICAVAQPPADLFKCLPLLQQRRPCTAVGGAHF